MFVCVFGVFGVFGVCVCVRVQANSGNIHKNSKTKEDVASPLARASTTDRRSAVGRAVCVSVWCVWCVCVCVCVCFECSVQRIKGSELRAAGSGGSNQQMIKRRNQSQ